MTGPTVTTSSLADGAPADSFAQGSRARRGWTLFIACAGVVLVIASMVALNTALGDIAKATSASQTQLTWIVDSYTLLLACLLLPAGAIGDRYGRRSALLVGVATFAVASAAPLVFGTPLQIIAARGLAGTGAAFVMPATLSLLTAAYPPEARTKAVGIWAGVAGCGGVFGLLGAGVLVQLWDWRSIFWTLAIGAAMVFALTLTIAESRDDDAPRLDVPGAVTIGAAVAVFVFGILQAPAHGWSDARVIGCLLAGAVLAVMFGFVELRRRQPLLDIRLFRDPSFGTGAAAITVVFLATFALFFLVVQYLQQVRGYSALTAAIALSPMALPLLSLSILSPWYLPRLGLRAVVFASMALVAIGFLCMGTLTTHSSYLEVAWPLVVISTGFGLCTAPTTSAIMTAAPEKKQGVASAVNDATREVGGAFGIALAGSILAGSYSRHVGAALAGYPEQVRAPASDSLATALAVADRLGPQGVALAERSKEAFVAAANTSYTVMAVIVAVAAVLISLIAPGRDGRRLRLTRRRRERAAS
ncbi:MULTISPECIES: MFS transporter [Mycobacterium]|uniref:MFS transporter n=1 Tax=Mycobacterium TaxID=1763 RepID=UPI001EE26EEF|nr:MULTISPECIES: MFS transporter [Mycobacterium]BDE16660.1 MFS transporter [Mycobacterium sp. 20KCMC460]GLB89930.1 MFS transporter [Mycobacterium kiyosense]GLC02736.1 MFS transporter [Mycobacterium kiyosense]GLC07869.1 MFS transporter [Mycobacterium kiyosense]GLC14591.1 MFS transporter [Mycobacterium kiyosense]